MTDHPAPDEAGVSPALAVFRARRAITAPLLLPAFRSSVDDLVAADPEQAGVELEATLTDPATPEHVLHDLLSSRHLSLVSPSVAGRAYSAWVSAAPRDRRERHNTLLALRHHCGPDAWLEVPLAELGTLPVDQLEALVSMHLGARAHDTFTALWEEWDGTLGGLIETARTLPRPPR